MADSDVDAPVFQTTIEPMLPDRSKRVADRWSCISHSRSGQRDTFCGWVLRLLQLIILILLLLLVFLHEKEVLKHVVTGQGDGSENLTDSVFSMIGDVKSLQRLLLVLAGALNPSRASLVNDLRIANIVQRNFTEKGFFRDVPTSPDVLSPFWRQSCEEKEFAEFWAIYCAFDHDFALILKSGARESVAEVNADSNLQYWNGAGVVNLADRRNERIIRMNFSRLTTFTDGLQEIAAIADFGEGFGGHEILSILQQRSRFIEIKDPACLKSFVLCDESLLCVDQNNQPRYIIIRNVKIGGGSDLLRLYFFLKRFIE